MASKASSVWLPQVLIESALIVVSILVALGLDEWRDDRQDAEMVQNALSNFLIEIQQNQSRVEDTAPFNRGLRQVLRRHYEANDIDTVDQFVNMVESFSPVWFHSTAWDTALATGSLAKMEYDLVRALTLTYSLQSRYQFATRVGMNEITSPQNLSQDKLNLAFYNSIRYLDDIIGLETELSVTYTQAMLVIQDAILRLEFGSDLATPAAPEAHILAHP